MKAHKPIMGANRLSHSQHPTLLSSEPGYFESGEGDTGGGGACGGAETLDVNPFLFFLFFLGGRCGNVLWFL
jgi:hypothetical protein